MTTDRSEKWFWTPRSFHNALGTRPSDGWHTRRVTTFDPARRLDQIDVAGLKSHAPIARGPLLIVKKGVRKTAAGQSQRPPPPPPRGLEEGGGGGQGGGEGWRRRGERETLPFLIPSLSLSLPLSLSLSLSLSPSLSLSLSPAPWCPPKSVSNARLQFTPEWSARVGARQLQAVTPAFCAASTNRGTGRRRGRAGVGVGVRVRANDDASHD